MALKWCPNPSTCEHVSLADKSNFADMIEYRPWDEEIVLDYASGPNAVTRVLQMKQLGESESEKWGHN